MTLFFVILTLVGFACCAFLYLQYEKLKKSSQELTIRTRDRDEFLFSNIPFFYKNPVLNIELSTPALRKLLDIEGNYSLEQLRDFFRRENPGVLGTALQSLHDQEKLAPIYLTLPNKKKKVKCIVQKILNDEGKLSGILLLFDRTRNDIVSSSKKLQQELMSLLNILNNSPYPMWERNEDLEVTYVNFAYINLLGEKLPLISEKNGIEFYSKGQELAKQALNDKKIATERQYIVVGGKRKLFQITEIPINRQTTIGLARDISEQGEIEEELEKNLSTQSQFLESSASATGIYGPDKKLRFYNSSFAALWELDEKWLEKMPTYGDLLEKLRETRKLPEQADFKSFKEHQLALFQELIEPSDEFLYLPDGTVLRVIIVPHESGGLIFSYEDITDRLALEQSYNTLIAVKKATIDNLHEGIAVFQENGHIGLYNPTFTEMWHLDSDFLDKGPHLSEILDETEFLYDYKDDWNKFKNNIIAILSTHTAENNRIIRKDGSVLDWNKVPLPDGNILVTYSDITDSFLVEKSLRSEKEALKEADELKSNFLANVSYELRSPLTSIKGFSESLLNKYFGEINDKQKEYLEGIYESSLNLTSLIDDILEMASINAGYMTPNFEEFDLCKEVKKIKNHLKNKAKQVNQRLEIICPDDIGNIKADKTRIAKIITNLVSHAISQNKTNGSVILEVRPVNNEIQIIVRDEGQGLDETEQEIIFEQFYKTKSENRDAEITSLALPIVKSFVELHNGAIDVESVKNKGTTIICTLPRDSSEDINERVISNVP